MGNGGFGLPDRDYFLRPQFADKNAKYQTYVALMLRLAADIIALTIQYGRYGYRRITALLRNAG